VLVSGVFASPAFAQQSLNIYFGGFSPNGEDSRIKDNGVSNDVLVNNLDFFAFNISDFRGGIVGADYLAGLGEFLEAGAAENDARDQSGAQVGVSDYRRSAKRLRAQHSAGREPALFDHVQDAPEMSSWHVFLITIAGDSKLGRVKRRNCSQDCSNGLSRPYDRDRP
jgi:hypothetical protein